MIVVVAGLPRSGSSLMMQMLEAGGMEILTDEKRGADDSNQKGYYEYAPVLKIDKDNTWMYKAEGKAVKILTHLIKHVPTEFEYKVIYMTRDLDEVLDSQDKMIGVESKNRGVVKEMLRKYDANIFSWVITRDNFEVTHCYYNQILKDPRNTAEHINMFLGGWLDEEKMISVVDENLYRSRGPTS